MILGLAPVLVALAWIVIGTMAAVVITGLAGRLLGVRRGWISLWVAGLVGWTLAVLGAGLLTGWTWSSPEMVLAALVLGPITTMVAAVGLDLLAHPGSLTPSDRAGLLSLPHPIRSVRQAVAPIGRYREVLRIAAANGLLHRPRRGAHLEGTQVAVRRTLEQAGGMFVKLGQVASTRTDVLPEPDVRGALEAADVGRAGPPGGHPAGAGGGARPPRDRGLRRLRLDAAGQRVDRPGLRGRSTAARTSS